MESLQPLRTEAGAVTPRPLDLTGAEQVARDLIAPAFDRAYYLLANQDVCAVAIEPLDHFVQSGRHEGRRPAHHFDPPFYRDAHAGEVEGSGHDPFSFYILTGQAQGHLTRRRHAPARRALAAAQPPAAPVPRHDTVAHLHFRVLVDMLRGRLAAAAGLTLSVSHARLEDGVGGIQILVADEQAALNARNEAYLHIVPVIPSAALAPDGLAPNGPILDGLAPHYLHVALDGVHLGAVTGDELVQALAELAPDLPRLRRFVVHCLLGHGIRTLTALHGALGHPEAGPPQAVFWVHDYGTVCIGYTLLRNDAAFCGAPPPDSAACGVCVYGAARQAHLAGIQALFEAVPFQVAAPSASALALWLRKAGLPHRSARVMDVLRIEDTATRRHVAGAPERGAAGNPVRVAFAGHATRHKGWEAFREIAAELRRSGAYRFLHLSAGGDEGLPGVTHLPVRVSPAAPDAMVAALRDCSADLVLVVSPWPETFSIVAHEALAAGADVLTLACSGNVADLVRRTGRGRVFATADDMAAYLAGTEAVRDVRARHAAGAGMGRIRLLGATAGADWRDDGPSAAQGLPDLAGAA